MRVLECGVVKRRFIVSLKSIFENIHTMYGSRDLHVDRYESARDARRKVRIISDITIASLYKFHRNVRDEAVI